MSELLSRDVITVQEAQIAYDKMKEKGRRLPWDEVKQQLAQFKKR
jgi:hypothetical protein